MAVLQADLLLNLGEAEAQVEQLGSLIEQQVSDVTLEVDVEVNDEQVQTALGDLEAAEVDVIADVESAQADIDSLEAGSVELEVEADTSGAEAEITGLADATTGLGGAASLAEGDLSGAASAAGLFGEEAGAVAGVVVAAGAAFGVIGSQALEAAGAEQRFAAVTGDLGNELKAIDIAGLSTDLGELAISLGGSDEAALAASTRIAAIGENAGLTDSEINTLNDGLFAFEAAAISSGLATGQLGDNTQRLLSGFARGGRFLQNFGVSLTSAEINARALADTGKATAAELTQIEKAQAGLNLALEQNPDIAAQVAAGQANIQTSVAATRARFEELIESLGTPFIEPFTEGLARAEGPMQSFAEQAGAMAEGAALAAPSIEQLGLAMGVFGIQTEETAIGLDALTSGGLTALADLGGLAEGGETLGKSFGDSAVAAEQLAEGESEVAAGAAAAQAEVNALVQAATGLAPSLGGAIENVSKAGDAFGILEAESNPVLIAQNLEAMIESFQNFTDNVETIANQGGSRVAEALGQLGPEVAGSLAASLATLPPEFTTNLESLLAQAEASGLDLGEVLASTVGAATGQIPGIIQGQTGPVQSASDAVGQAGATGFDAGFALTQGLITTQMILAAGTVLAGGPAVISSSQAVGRAAGTGLGASFASTSVPFVQLAMTSVRFAIIGQGASLAGSARAVGSQIGVSLGQGIVSGLNTQLGSIVAAAANAVNQAEQAARNAADANSPSRLFASLGSDMGEGLAIGFADAASALIGSAEAITRAAAASPGGTTVVGGGPASVQVAVRIDGSTTPEAAREFRAGAGDLAEGIAGALRKQQFDVAAGS